MVILLCLQSDSLYLIEEEEELLKGNKTIIFFVSGKMKLWKCHVNVDHINVWA